MHKKLMGLFGVTLLATTTAIASPTVCPTVKMENNIGISLKARHYFIFLETNNRNLTNMRVVYNIDHQPPVSKIMLKMGGQGLAFESNEIIVNPNQTLNYHFEYYYKTTPCSSEEFSFTPDK